MNLLARRENDIPPELERIFPGAEEFFRDVFGVISPGSFTRRRGNMICDLKVGEDEVTLQLACPGHKAEDFDIEIAGTLLTVKTCCSCEEQHGGAGHSYIFKERACMNFEETFHLPVEVVSSDAKASYDEGVLRISLPREAQKAPRIRKIEVKSAK